MIVEAEFDETIVARQCAHDVGPVRQHRRAAKVETSQRFVAIDHRRDGLAQRLAGSAAMAAKDVEQRQRRVLRSGVGQRAHLCILPKVVGHEAEIGERAALQQLDHGIKPRQRHR